VLIGGIATISSQADRLDAASGSTMASWDSRSFTLPQDANTKQIQCVGDLTCGGANVGQLRILAADAVDLAGEVLQGRGHRLRVELDGRVAQRQQSQDARGAVGGRQRDGLIGSGS
jgi:hypothetical protein